jgi:hypothetical protein
VSDRVTLEEGRRLMAKAQSEQPETVIRRQIRDYLTTLGWLVVYHMQGPLSYKGFPDLTALREGRTVYIEVKTAKGKLSTHQRAFREACEGHGGQYVVARCIEDVAKAIERGSK